MGVEGLIKDFVRNHMNLDFSPGWGSVCVRQIEVGRRQGDLRRDSPHPTPQIIQSR